MALTGTIQANLVANLTKFSAPMKKAVTLTQQLQGSMKSLQSAAKFALGSVGIQKFGNFVKKSLAEAAKEGSALQEALGGRAVKAAKELQSAFESINTSLQKTVLTILGELTPVIERLANLLAEIDKRLGGNPGGVSASVAAERKANVAANLTPQQRLDAARGQQAALQSRLDKLNSQVAEEKGLSDIPLVRFATAVNKTRANEIEVLKSQLFNVGVEIQSFEKNMTALNNAVAAKGLVNAGRGFLGFLQQASPLGAFQSGGSFLGKTLAARFGGQFANPLSFLFPGQPGLVDRTEAIAERARQLAEESGTRRPGAFSRGTDETLDRIAQITAANRGAKDFIDIAEEQLEQEKQQHDELIRAIEQRLPAAIRLAFPVPARF